VFVPTFSLAAQGLDGDSVCLLDELIRDRFKLFQDGGGFIKPRAGRKILQISREIAGDRRKLREHAAAFVGRFAQARPSLIRKDFGLILEAADEGLVPMPLAGLIHERLTATVAKSREDADWAGVAREISESAGL
jgi:hypothetical protein